MIQEVSRYNETICYDIVSEGFHAEGIATNIPDSELYILQVRCAHGMLFCGIYHPDVLEKLKFPAAIFSAPKLEDMMERKPVFLTQAALDKGASPDMTGAELVALFSR